MLIGSRGGGLQQQIIRCRDGRLVSYARHRKIVVVEGIHRQISGIRPVITFRHLKWNPHGT